MARILVTGGCGFIGSNFLNLMVSRFPQHSFLNMDALTYAANPENIKVAHKPNYIFTQTDITDRLMVQKVFEVYRPEWVVNFAAESHVDRSINNPDRCVETNVLGTINLLDACTRLWKDTTSKVYLQISTDEVFGDLPVNVSPYKETTPYQPSTPYAASKAAADHFVKIYQKTYGLPALISNCTNNYGPGQHNEKFIPKMIGLIGTQQPLTLHGRGQHIRDWIFVEDHCEAVWQVLTEGKIGESYNIGGNMQLTNFAVVDQLCQLMAPRLQQSYEDLIKYVVFMPDRPANDFRYALDFTKIQQEFGWAPTTSFTVGLEKTLNSLLCSTL